MSFPPLTTPPESIFKILCDIFRIDVAKIGLVFDANANLFGHCRFRLGRLLNALVVGVAQPQPDIQGDLELTPCR